MSKGKSKKKKIGGHITHITPTTAYNLRKSINDLSKTKKRKEFEHDGKIQQKLKTLLDFSGVSKFQMKQARKVSKKVISEIES